jgi:SAM-dependent methyltransferase
LPFPQRILSNRQRIGHVGNMDERYWNELYGRRDQLFSGNPNGVLVTEVAGLKPGQALDVGCGEGADAHWLARQGWLVTAVDISRIALDRAAKLHRDTTRTEPNETAGGVCWTQADLAVTPPPARSFDLVSVQYFPLSKEKPALDGLLAAVAPGGTLLVVGHDPADLPPEFDRDDYHWPAEIAAMLGDGWTVLVDETRKRVTPPPPGSGHVNDTVLRARRHGQAG